MPRPSKETLRSREKQAILEEVKELALDAAKAAMQVMVDAVNAQPLTVVNEKTGKTEIVWPTPSTERMRAAQYILDQVVGQPTKKDAKAESDGDMQAVLSDIREFRKRAASGSVQS